MNNLVALLVCRTKKILKKISIDNNIISIRDSTVIPVVSIARITSHEFAIPWLLRLVLFFPAISFLAVRDLPFVTPFFTVIGLALLAAFVWTFTYKAYGVLIQTNGQTGNLMSTDDQNQARELFDALLVAIKDGGRQVPLVLENNKGSVTIVRGDLFKDIKGSNITNRSDAHEMINR